MLCAVSLTDFSKKDIKGIEICCALGPRFLHCCFYILPFRTLSLTLCILYIYKKYTRKRRDIYIYNHTSLDCYSSLRTIHGQTWHLTRPASTSV